MIKLNRTTEYSLIALRHMSRKGRAEHAAVTSAREIADSYGLPFEITAKTLQRLKDTGLIQSAQGARGGYTLQRSLNDVTLAEFLSLMEGPLSVVACGTNPAGKVKSDSCRCEYEMKCDIQHLMTSLNSKVLSFLSGIRLAELTEGNKSFSELPIAVGEEP